MLPTPTGKAPKSTPADVATQRRNALRRLENAGLLCRMAYRSETIKALRAHKVDGSTAVSLKANILARYQMVFRQKADEYMLKYPDVPHQLNLTNEDAKIAHKDWLRGLEIATRSVSGSCQSWFELLVNVSQAQPSCLAAR